MKHSPCIYELENLVTRVLKNDTQSSPDGVHWFPARPLGYPSLRRRWRAAWLVFTGRADAVLWIDDARDMKASSAALAQEGE